MSDEHTIIAQLQAHFRRVKPGARQMIKEAHLRAAIALAEQMCDSIDLYGFGNGSCPGQCYHYYDCGPASGGGGHQSNFLTNVKASGGFHNFSAQARALHRMARNGIFTPHWGRCEANLGDPPSGFINPPRHVRHRAHKASCATGWQWPRALPRCRRLAFSF